jgi:HEAT repeat protein
MKFSGPLFVLAVFANCTMSTSHQERLFVAHANGGVGLNSPVNRNENQTTTDEVSKLLQKLQSADDRDRKQAKKELGALARGSSEGREEAISELIKFVEGSNNRLRLSSEAHYDAWESAVALLGELKATEAIDSLIACIDCNDGTGGLSFDRYPALKALTKIGAEAVLKLTAALSDPRFNTRKYAALALGEIGGQRATPAMEQALLMEQNPEVVASLKIALRTLKTEESINR